MQQVMTNNASFLVEDDENLLDALERTGHQVEYQCRSGYCGACRTRVRSGKDNIHYDSLPLAFVAPDEVLPCCSKVTGQVDVDCTQVSEPHVQLELFNKCIPTVDTTTLASRT